jgi:oxygen-independent coproporphyrinogen-3 oxidase
MRRLMNILRSGYAFANDCEISIEIDPRRIEDPLLNTLKGLGFNRISIGVQDIDETVQAAINRTQCTEQVHTLVK